ncbi:hypothetical protein ICW40_14825 [Actinotalea ferrariae]|uniref:hypothetical protein n=1 Tax=Actinotalea ferrariae TaxID=1386098 RepID=UPI001C8C8F42|nr:hypothetical protein [Actinotalea ferrariae]MBX9246074.1 hypothetical protein [Actinotalea ferrariae]
MDDPTTVLPAARDAAAPAGAPSPTGWPEQRPTPTGPQPGAIALVPADRTLRVGQTFGSMTLPRTATPPAEAQPGTEAAAGAPGPRWSAVAPGQTGWTPTPEAPSSGSAAADAGPSGGASPVDARDAEPELDDEAGTQAPEPVRAHPYTWLHMIVLVVVAFVLGMLIFMVVMRDAPPADGTGQGAAADVVAAAPVLDATDLDDPPVGTTGGTDDPTGD